MPKKTERETISIVVDKDVAVWLRSFKKKTGHSISDIANKILLTQFEKEKKIK